jgi:hypothetical protein
MSNLKKIALGAVAFWVGLTLFHLRLNLGFDPAMALGFKKGVAQETRFRVGFLPVT